MNVFGCISLMSAPAANAFSPPANRMHPIVSSASRSSMASAISLKTPKDSALSIFGRLSVTMPTAPFFSMTMYSNVLMVYPAPDFARQCARWRSGHQVGVPGRRERDASGLSGGVTYDRNIRAAEAIVSSAPKPMKIFPMMEV